MHSKKLQKNHCFDIKTKTKTLNVCGNVYVRIFCNLIVRVFVTHVYK